MAASGRGQTPTQNRPPLTALHRLRKSGRPSQSVGRSRAKLRDGRLTVARPAVSDLAGSVVGPTAGAGTAAAGFGAAGSVDAIEPSVAANAVAFRWSHPLWAAARRRTGLPGSQTAKLVVATVAAYVVADQLLGGGSGPKLLAALTALLVVQVTLYETIRYGWQRIGSVIVGVLLAALLSAVFGLTWWSLGVTVVAALALGRVLRLGDHALEVPISAMVVLAVSSHTQVGLGRVYETLIGAIVGVLVSLVAPPVYVQPAGDAVGELADEIGQLLHSVAVDVERAWTHEGAMAALRRARGLEDTVRAARSALTRAENSLRLNPRRRSAHVPKRLRSALTALEYSMIHVRVSCRCLADRVDGVPTEDLPGEDVRRPLSELLDAAGAAVRAFGRLVGSDVTGPAGDADELRRAVWRARAVRAAASRALLVDAASEPELWHVHGAVLGHLDRLLDEIDPDADAAAHAIGQAVPVASASSLPRLSSAELRRRIRARLHARSGAMRAVRAVGRRARREPRAG